MTKKWLAFVCAAAVSLSIAGCGGSSGASSETPAAAPAEAQSAEAEDRAAPSKVPSVPAKSEKQEAPQEPTGPEIPQDYHPELAVKTIYSYEYDEESYENWSDISFDILYLSQASSELLPKLQERLKNDETETKARVETVKEEHRSMYEEFKHDEIPYYSAFMNRDSIFVHRADEQVLSYVDSFESYSGGVHGYYAYMGTNIDAQTGEDIPFDAVVKDRDAFAEVLEQLLRDGYPDSPFEGLHDTLETYVTGEYDFNFSMEPDGITLYFNPYEIASYAEGLLQAQVLYDAYPELFTDAYRPECEEWCLSVETNYAFMTDIDDDGTSDRLQVVAWEGEDYFIHEILLNWNEQTFDLSSDIYVYSVEPVLLHVADGRDFLFLSCMTEGESVLTRVILLDKGLAQEVGQFWGGWRDYYSIFNTELEGGMHAVLTDPRHFLVSESRTLFGSNGINAWFTLGDDGLAVPVNNPPLYAFSIPREITVSKPFTVMEVVSGNDVTLKAGDKLTLSLTDGASYVIASLNGDKDVRIEIEENTAEYDYLIDGTPVWEYFDDLLYAG